MTPATRTDGPRILAENDVFLRLLQVILDRDTPKERRDAFADFFHHDMPNFLDWCAEVRDAAPKLAGARVEMIDDAAMLHKRLPGATALITESLPFGPEEITLAGNLRVVQKYGEGLRNISVDAARTAGIKVLTLRRRANIACAEHIILLMLGLARRMPELMNRISVPQMAELGFDYRPFDRRHTPGSNWARIPGIRMLFQSRLGILGMGEIGRELALRANAFGMDVIYSQRTRLPEAEERALNLRFLPLEQMLAECDWIVPQLPATPATRHILNHDNLSRVRTGAMLVNVSRADIVERVAVIDLLRSGRLGGFGLDSQYETPGREDDELLSFGNVMLTPHLGGSPRSNALEDFKELIGNLEREV